MFSVMLFVAFAKLVQLLAVAVFSFLSHGAASLFAIILLEEFRSQGTRAF